MNNISLKLICCLLIIFNYDILTAQIIDNFKSHTTILSSDKMEGRGAGSKGIQKSGDYISEQFQKLGLQPLKDGTYKQYFPYPDQKEPEANIIGIISASEPTEKSLVFTAHYDGYGIRKTEGTEDSIYNGARDNAVGVAALIELARIYKNEKLPPVNLVFIATAGEEFGQHGAEFYLEQPVFETKKIIFCLNFDGFNVSGKRSDFFMMPRQGVDFVDEIILTAQRSGWMYNPPEWVDAMNKNFDSASFLKRGIPSVTLWAGDRLLGGEIAPKLNFGDIHSPFDEINEEWDWSGVEDHLKLYKRIADYFMRSNKNVLVKNPELFQ
ncbi:M28 family peptidase [Lutimonas saemankumensis]|uniref:M20/M25/M40 family metallo-hydrolase n=1 Tax=Lutimonas saemankumensis TaxID=483016 RepID=UPI001CD7F294|nr:M20/M25/M40 family metallo-hydrolase [Lutimonas saemankumensis]MCA0932357.1 M28 family peptidase [Lutimonas saemankumensis]